MSVALDMARTLERKVTQGGLPPTVKNGSATSTHAKKSTESNLINDVLLPHYQKINKVEMAKRRAKGMCYK